MFVCVCVCVCLLDYLGLPRRFVPCLLSLPSRQFLVLFFVFVVVVVVAVVGFSIPRLG